MTARKQIDTARGIGHARARARGASIDRDARAWAIVLRTLEHGFTLHKPDAMAKALAALKQATEAAAKDHEPEWAQEYERRAQILHDMVKSNQKTWLHVVDIDGGTPETVGRPSRYDPVQKLYQIGHLDDAQRRAALRMAQVVESVVRAVAAKGQNFQRSSITRGQISDRTAFEHHDVYLPWALLQREYQGRGERHLDIVLDVVVWRRSIGKARARWSMSYPRALQFVADGLSDYAKLLMAYDRSNRDEGEAK